MFSLPSPAVSPVVPGAAKPSFPSYHSLESLTIPTAEEEGIAADDQDVGHIFTAGIQELQAAAERKQPAVHDVKYRRGDLNPWRNGTDDSPITDTAIIAREERWKRKVEQEDKTAAPSSKLTADRLHGFGIRIDFLLHLTWELNLWEWETWEVVQFLVKPATEQHNRCRFAELPLVRRFTGPATVYASHCWGAKWGDLVAAVCAGADTRRVVWIDVFAVRQWPGNGADLDFRGVIARSRAAIVAVAVAPVEGRLTAGDMRIGSEVDAFLASAGYTEAAKVQALFRLWCLVEIFAAIQAKKGLIFRCAAVASVDEAGRRVVLAGDAGWGEEKAARVRLLRNCAKIVDLEGYLEGRAECGVAADRDREIKKVQSANAGRGGIAGASKAVASAINSGIAAVEHDNAAVDNFVCGETEALRALQLGGEIKAAVKAACAAGQVGVLQELLNDGRGGGGDGGSGASSPAAAARAAQAAEAQRVVETHPYPLWAAAYNGREGVVELLLGVKGVDVNRGHPGSGATPFYVACENGHEGVVQMLLAHGETGVTYTQARTDNGSTPLHVASEFGHEGVVRILLTLGETDVNQAQTTIGQTPLILACNSGQEGVVRLLLAHATTDVNRATTDTGATALIAASQEGHEGVVRLMLAHAATDVNQATTDKHALTALIMACSRGHEGVVRALIAHRTTDLNQATTDYGFTPLFMACRQGHEEVVRLLLAHAATDVNQAMTGTGTTPLLVACEKGYAEVVRLLLAHSDTDVNRARIFDEATPLHTACQQGHEAVVRLLLAHAATDVNRAMTGSRFTPLSMACYEGHEGVVRLLLEEGGTDQSQSATEAALSVAEQAGHNGVVELLRQHTAELEAAEAEAK